MEKMMVTDSVAVIACESFLDTKTSSTSRMEEFASCETRVRRAGTNVRFDMHCLGRHLQGRPDRPNTPALFGAYPYSMYPNAVCTLVSFV